MSCIYFHSYNTKVAVHGSERAHFGVLCRNLVWNVLSSYAEDSTTAPSVLRRLFPKGHYLLDSKEFKIDCVNYLGGSPLEYVYLGDEKIQIFELQLNTALSMGANFIQLAARLHGQCEVHAYVEGKNRKWLAEIIKKGRASKFYRDGMGWEMVIKLLESDHTTPIVTSYSDCRSFPNSTIAGYPDNNSKAFPLLPRERQWELALKVIRQPHSGLELKPEDWDDNHFSKGIDANKLLHGLLQQAQMEKKQQAGSLRYSRNLI